MQLIKKEQIAKNTYAFYFKKSPDFTFIPGQYVRVTLPHEDQDDRGDKRFFSLAISPNDKEFIRIITKIIPKSSTFKKNFYNLQAGTEVHISPPMGKFVLKEEADSHIFLVGGIGITPVISIVSWAREVGYKKPITVLVSFSTAEEIVLKEELEKNNSNIKVIYTVTHPEGSWSGEEGRISNDLIKKYTGDFQKPYYYVVGPPAMVDAMIKLVENMSIPQEQIVKETFTGY